METRRLGASGLKLSLVGLGCNNFGDRMDYAATESVVERALDLGITHFDTADIYGSGLSEEFLGKALGARRKDIVLATKFGQRLKSQPPVPNRGSRDYVMSAVEASLKRLRTDWIDLLFMHVPDRSTPVDETLRALDDLRRDGKVRYIGASNFRAGEVTDAAAAARLLNIEGFVGCQDGLSLLDRRIEKALLPRMRKLGLGLIPYRPLAGGALSGKYRMGALIPEGTKYASNRPAAKRFLDPNWGRIETLRGYAEARGHTLLELAMSWLAQKPEVASIVAGATKPEQLDANVKATGWMLGDTEMAEIDAMTAKDWRRMLHLTGLAGFSRRRQAE